jgi:hypothetical protein
MYLTRTPCLILISLSKATVKKAICSDTYLLTQITGTGHGIGKELARQYCTLNATVVCWDINEEENDKTVQELRKSGFKVYGYRWVSCYFIYPLSRFVTAVTKACHYSRFRAIQSNQLNPPCFFQMYFHTVALS